MIYGLTKWKKNYKQIAKEVIELEIKALKKLKIQLITLSTKLLRQYQNVNLK